MSPGLPSSNSPEPPDPLALLDDVVRDLLDPPILDRGDAALIPPIAGGAPGLIDDIVNAILGPIYDAARWILDNVLTWVNWIEDRVWDAATWVHDYLYTMGVWLGGRVWTVGDWVLDNVLTWVNWIEDRVWDAATWVHDYLYYVGDWLGDRVWVVGSWVLDNVLGWVNWLKDRVWDAATWVYDYLYYVGDWLGDQVWVVGDWVLDNVLGWVNWLKDRVWDAAAWVWDQVWAGLEWAWDNVISKIPEGIIAGAAEIGRLIREAFEWLVNSAFEPFVDVVQRKLAIPGKLIRAEYGSLEELLDDMLDPPLEMLKGWTGMILLPFVVVGLLVNMITGLSGPLLEPILQEQARSVGARIPPFALLRDGYLRGLLADDAHDDWLGRSGFDAANIELQKALYDEIPGPSDLITMGVREVFTPEIAERFGQFEDLPPAFVEWMAKQGYTEEWARNFWAMHWGLPSTTQGFEMYHRGVIELADLELLLRAQDVMPFWRENLIEIAYRVISRVDVRRMYAEGVFDQDQVLRVYRDLGYKPEDAEALTEFVVRRYPPKGAETADDLRSVTVTTIRQALARRLITHDDALENLQELDYSADDAQLVMSIWEFDWTQDPSLRSDVDPKGLARSVIEKAYERRLIDLNGGVRELGELGYTPEDARLLLQLVDLRLDEQLADLEIDGLVSDYQDGVITDAQLAAALADLHVPEARVDFLLQREILVRRAKRRRLTLAQMKKAVAEKLMDVGEYQARLDVMGYNRRDVDILVALNVESV